MKVQCVETLEEFIWSMVFSWINFLTVLAVVIHSTLTSWFKATVKCFNKFLWKERTFTKLLEVLPSKGLLRYYWLLTTNDCVYTLPQRSSANSIYGSVIVSCFLSLDNLKNDEKICHVVIFLFQAHCL